MLQDLPPGFGYKTASPAGNAMEGHKPPTSSTQSGVVPEGLNSMHMAGSGRGSSAGAKSAQHSGAAAAMGPLGVGQLQLPEDAAEEPPAAENRSPNLEDEEPSPGSAAATAKDVKHHAKRLQRRFNILAEGMQPGRVRAFFQDFMAPLQKATTELRQAARHWKKVKGRSKQSKSQPSQATDASTAPEPGPGEGTQGCLQAMPPETLPSPHAATPGSNTLQSAATPAQPSAAASPIPKPASLPAVPYQLKHAHAMPTFNPADGIQILRDLAAFGHSRHIAYYPVGCEAAARQQEGISFRAGAFGPKELDPESHALHIDSVVVTTEATYHETEYTLCSVAELLEGQGGLTPDDTLDSMGEVAGFLRNPSPQVAQVQGQPRQDSIARDAAHGLALHWQTVGGWHGNARAETLLIKDSGRAVWMGGGGLPLPHAGKRLFPSCVPGNSSTQQFEEHWYAPYVEDMHILPNSDASALTEEDIKLLRLGDLWGLGMVLACLYGLADKVPRATSGRWLRYEQQVSIYIPAYFLILACRAAQNVMPLRIGRLPVAASFHRRRRAMRSKPLHVRLPSSEVSCPAPREVRTVDVSPTLWAASGRNILVANLQQRLLTRDHWAAGVPTPCLDLAIRHPALLRDDEWVECLRSIRSCSSTFQQQPGPQGPCWGKGSSETLSWKPMPDAPGESRFDQTYTNALSRITCKHGGSLPFTTLLKATASARTAEVHFFDGTNKQFPEYATVQHIPGGVIQLLKEMQPNGVPGALAVGCRLGTHQVWQALQDFIPRNLGRGEDYLWEFDQQTWREATWVVSKSPQKKPKHT
ncbi:hypothetical protein WJX74_005425 [Apatococcus lobatus]|uniref:Protein kinase domain-containing protein n=1 Tax=Apatococcus lobatus TaxID=904363 RepID=A0AAW1RF63_9CHLO